MLHTVMLNAPLNTALDITTPFPMWTFFNDFERITEDNRVELCKEPLSALFARLIEGTVFSSFESLCVFLDALSLIAPKQIISPASPSK